MVRQQDRRGRITLAQVWVRQNILTTVLIIFIVLSLLLHVLTIGALFRVRLIVNRQLDVSADQLARVRQQEISYMLPIDQTFWLDTTIAVDETVTVPLDLTVPISDTLSLPISEFELQIPLYITVPISDTVDVPLNGRIPVRAEVPINTEVPIQLQVDNSPFGDILKQLEDGLRELRASLN